MSRLSRLSEVSERSIDDEASNSSSSTRTPNFSRPRIQSYGSGEFIYIWDRGPPSNLHTVSAFHEPNRELPDEPRFSGESERTTTISPDNSAGSELAWDGERGELVSISRKQQFDEQRYSSQPQLRPTTAKTTTTDNSMSSTSSMSAFAIARRQNATQIHKRVSVDVQRDTTLLHTNNQYEDTSSHHTVSDDEDELEALAVGADGEWRSSDYSTTGLSDAKIKKLLRKGVNPSLYAEMQAAQKKSKSKWIGPLIANSFIS